jgi:hypothetical protein
MNVCMYLLSHHLPFSSHNGPAYLVISVSSTSSLCYEVGKSNAAHKCYKAASTWSIWITFQFIIVTECQAFYIASTKLWLLFIKSVFQLL